MKVNPEKSVSLNGKSYLFIISDDLRYKCPTCGNSYKYKQGLYTHRRFRCGKEPQFGCPHCPKKCFVRGDLQQHLLSCKLNPDAEMLQFKQQSVMQLNVQKVWQPPNNP